MHPGVADDAEREVGPVLLRVVAVADLGNQRRRRIEVMPRGIQRGTEQRIAQHLFALHRGVGIRRKTPRPERSLLPGVEARHRAVAVPVPPRPHLVNLRGDRPPLDRLRKVRPAAPVRLRSRTEKLPFRL